MKTMRVPGSRSPFSNRTRRAIGESAPVCDPVGRARRLWRDGPPDPQLSKGATRSASRGSIRVERARARGGPQPCRADVRKSCEHHAKSAHSNTNLPLENSATGLQNFLSRLGVPVAGSWFVRPGWRARSRSRAPKSRIRNPRPKREFCGHAGVPETRGVVDVLVAEDFGSPDLHVSRRQAGQLDGPSRRRVRADVGPTNGLAQDRSPTHPVARTRPSGVLEPARDCDFTVVDHRVDQDLMGQGGPATVARHQRVAAATPPPPLLP